MIIRSVSLLLASRGPIAIFRAVIAVVVASFNLVICAWPFSHVSQEIAKGISPTLANCNAPAAIPGIGMASRIATATLHVLPRRISFGPFAATGVAVGKVCDMAVSYNNVSHDEALLFRVAYG